MDCLVAAGSKNRSSKYLLRPGIGDRHHEPKRFAFFDGAAHAGHRTPPHKKRPPAGARLRLGQAHAAERRIDVERVAQNAIAYAPPLAVQEVRGDDLEVVIGRVGEGAAAIAVAKRQIPGALVRSSSSTAI